MQALRNRTVTVTVVDTWVAHGLHDHQRHMHLSVSNPGMLLQELNSSSAARAPGLGLTGMKALSPFVSGLIVSGGEWCAADSFGRAGKGDQATAGFIEHGTMQLQQSCVSNSRQCTWHGDVCSWEWAASKVTQLPRDTHGMLLSASMQCKPHYLT